MYNNKYYPDDYQSSPLPRKKRRGRRTSFVSIFLVIVLMLASGALGGLVVVVGLDNTAQSPGTVIYESTTSQPVTIGSYESIYEQVAAKTADSVVEVSTESKVTHPFWGSYVTGGAGSGVIITQDGYIVTNHHVIDGSTSITVRTRAGESHVARLVASDAQTDLALLKIDAQGLVPSVLGDSDGIRVGQLAVAVGNPLGTLGGTVTEGIISAKDREMVIDGEVMRLLQTSAAINPGNSGGGLFNANSELIGVVNAKSSGSEIEGLGFAIPVNTVKTVIRDLMDHGYVAGRPALGIQITLVSGRNAMYYYGTNQSGVYVSESVNAELQQWDCLVSIDGQVVDGVEDVTRAIQAHAIGDVIDVSVLRNRQTVNLRIELTERTQQMTDAGLV